MAHVGPRALSLTAYEALTERLVLLDIPPGARIDERALMQELGIGRTPLREALKRLEADHFVVTRPRSGTFASTVDVTSLAEISEVRSALEPLAAALAAQRADDADRSAIEVLQVRLAAVTAGTPARDLMEIDKQVHALVHAATHNAHLRAALTRYGNLATRIWSVAAPHLAGVGAHVVEHTALLDSVAQGRADEAASLMRTHMDEFETRIRPALGRASVPAVHPDRPPR